MEEDSEEITISYETLFELLVRERGRGELQKLPQDFYDNVLKYLKEKESQLNQEELDAAIEKPKIKKEIENIKQILKDLYNKREKKIVNLALDKSKTQSSIVDVNLLLKEEKELFDELVNSLDEKRKLSMDILNGGVKDITKKEEADESKEEPKVKEEVEKSENTKVSQESEQDESNAVGDQDESSDVQKEGESGTKLVRFVHAVPKFLGLEGEEYGPFEEEDVASLPSEIVNLLLKKERVEEIKES